MNQMVFESFRKLHSTLNDDNSAIERLQPCINRQSVACPWFAPEFCKYSLRALKCLISDTSLEEFCKHYDSSSHKRLSSNKKIAVFSNNTTPLEIFGDLVLVLLSGNTFLGRTDSAKNILFKGVLKLFLDVAPELADKIILSDNLRDADAIIADVNEENETAFRRYFSKIHGYYRKKKHAVAVLSGRETDDEIQLLAEDIVTYFGMGMLSIKKLFVPKEYDFTTLFSSISAISSTLDLHNQYLNNLEYQKTIFLMAQRPFLDAGTMIFVESDADFPPTGVVHFQKHENSPFSNDEINELHKKYSRIATSANTSYRFCPFGKSNLPSATDLLFDNSLTELLFENRQK